MEQAVRSQRYWSITEGRSRQLSSRRAAKRNFAILSHRRTLASEVALLGFILALLQVADGILTGVGMARFGIGMEGNVILRALMDTIGYIPALVLVKSTAIGVVAGICIHGSKVLWLKPALKGVIALYVVCAVLPWTFLLTASFMA